MTGTKTHTATVDAAQFYLAVANASLFASTDDTLPALCSAHIVGNDQGELRFEASNRYIASRETLALIDREHDTSHPDHDKCKPVASALDIIVPIKGLKKITDMLKKLEERGYGMTEQPKIIIEWVDGDDSKHASFTLTDHLAPDQTLRTEVLGYGEFPRLDTIFESYRAKPEVASDIPGMRGDEQTWELPSDFTVAGKWLAVLAKVATGDKDPSVEISLGLRSSRGSVKPFTVTVGERFKAIVVPLRPPL